VGERGDISQGDDARIAELVSQYVRETSGIFRTSFDPKEFPTGREILSLPPALAARAVLVVMESLTSSRSMVSIYPEAAVRKGLLSALLRKPLPISCQEFAELLSGFHLKRFWDLWHRIPLRGILRAWAKRIESEGLSSDARDTLTDLRGWLDNGSDGNSATASCTKAIDEMLGQALQQPAVSLTPGEAWSDQAIADISAMSPLERDDWRRLLEYVRTANGARPTKKWLRGAEPLLAAVGLDTFATVVGRWFAAFPGPRTNRLLVTGEYGGDPNLKIAPESADILRGLAWCCAGCDHAGLSRALGEAVSSGFKKVREFGPRCPKVANAALHALSQMPGEEPVGQLARLAEQVKQPTGRKNIQKALQAVATRTGQSLEDLAEQAVPTFGLDSQGVCRRHVGECIAELRLDDSGGGLRWFGADGKPRKAVPQSARQEHADVVKELQRSVKDLQKMFTAQRGRVERLLGVQRSWPIAHWRARYHDHPLVGRLSRRLIWRFESGGRSTDAVWNGDGWMTADDVPFEPPNDALVIPWHPILSDPARVLGWRQFLERHRITQPFKQAHREIYPLTDAERTTVIYSNRFAGHILRQHQFVALCEQRGWRTGLQGSWDPGRDLTPTVLLPRWNLKAQFWIEAIHNEETSGTGMALYVGTDQVRFYRPDDREPMALEEVPPLAFSEVMRDVDLFVGVASVGNDPTWQDGGPDGHYRDYWQSYAFGYLTATAQTRKAVLETLLPALKIRDRVSLSGRFLVVLGNVRTYKIHLGSSNIQMEPNDQYLCIVPSRGDGSSAMIGNLFLPFEGDQTLAVILSKAFMLAADDKIADPTIIRQIKT
jgi:hypothetical protein